MKRDSQPWGWGAFRPASTQRVYPCVYVLRRRQPVEYDMNDWEVELTFAGAEPSAEERARGELELADGTLLRLARPDLASPRWTGNRVPWRAPSPVAPDAPPAPSDEGDGPLARGDSEPSRKALKGRASGRRQGPFATARCHEPPPPLLLQGVEEFNRGAYFEQHETLERLWRDEPDDVRYLYQGILLVGVGFYHLTRGNYHGAVVKLQQGMALLRWFAPACQRVDVARLLREARRVLDAALEGGPASLGWLAALPLPQVHLLDVGPPPSA
ncbi:MAG TPA: DUF309 domain-containing protein [Chloroflexota bacterium]